MRYPGDKREDNGAMPDSNDDAPDTGATNTGSATDPPDSPPDTLGDAGKRALAAERKAARDAQRRADELAARLREFEDRDKTELQRAIERADAAEKAAADLTARATRYEVAAAKGLTTRQAARLIGTTREELEADADELLADLNAGRTGRVPDFDAGVRTNGSAAPSMNDAIRRMAGRR
jgi:hypothetical protein